MSVIDQSSLGKDKCKLRIYCPILAKFVVYHACQRANYPTLSLGHLVIIPRIAAPVKRSDKSKVFNLGVIIPQISGQPIIFHQLNAVINLFGCYLELLCQIF